MADSKASFLPRGPIGIWRALLWSLRGIRHAFLTESSFRLEVYALLVVAPAAVALGANPVERAILLGSVLMVPAAELFNSALEAIVDKTSPEFHELAGRAKDMGSAAVFGFMVNAVACWTLVLWPRFA